MTIALRGVLIAGGLIATVLLAPAQLAAASADRGEIQSVQEVASSDLSIVPVGQARSYFSLTLRPGEKSNYSVALGNSGSSAAEYRTYAADVSTLEGGGLVAAVSGSRRTGTTTWLTYPEATATLGAGQTRLTPVAITVPSNALSGQYISSLVIENAAPVAIGNVARIGQILRMVIAVSITVPGPLSPAFNAGRTTYEGSGALFRLKVPLTNGGNANLKPAGVIRVTNSADVLVFSLPVSMGSFYSHTATSLVLSTPSRLAPGFYSVDVELTDRVSGVWASSSKSSLIIGHPQVAHPPALDERMTLLSVGGGFVLGLAGLLVSVVIFFRATSKRRHTSRHIQS